VAKVVYSPHAVQDLERLADFLLEQDPAAATRTFGLISEAIRILMHHPLIGRPVADDIRELIISRGKTGHVAQYGFDDAYDTVLILAIRHQREAGFRDM
jgi:plasmid stabilization system protein ParE